MSSVPSQIMKINMITESEKFPKGHGVHTAYLNMVEMLREKGVEVVVNSSEKSDITHIQTIGPFSLYKLLTNKPTVISAHVVPASFIGSLVLAKYWSWEAKAYLSFFYNRANLVLAVAPKVKDQLEEIGVRGRIEIFPNPINQKTFKKESSLRKEGRRLLNLQEKDFVNLSVGQAQPRKGIIDFIEVARSHPKMQFVWVGGRPFKRLTAETVKIDQALKVKPENFQIFDNIDYTDMPKVYNAADTFFYPSYQENAPMAIIEAASCGLALLLRDIEEYRLLYGDGYLKAGNEGFGTILEKLYSNTKFYNRAVSESTKLAKKYSFAVLGEKLVNYYQSLL